MNYFESPVTPGDGRCSDRSCPCPEPGALIPRGQGYLYISADAVRFRSDCLSWDNFLEKMEQLSERCNAQFVFHDKSAINAILICEQGARKRKLDLEVAAADAKYWWETGNVPLQATPLAGVKIEARANVEKPQQKEAEGKRSQEVKEEKIVTSRIPFLISLISVVLGISVSIGIFSRQYQVNKEKDNICAEIFRKNFWQKVQLYPDSSIRLLNHIDQSTGIHDPEVENYIQKLQVMSDIFLGVPDSSWLDFAYRHNRIPVVGNRAKCALSMDVKEATLGSKEYGFGLTTTVKRKQFTAILTIRENDKIIYEQDFVDTDPPLPSSITVRTINGAPVGYQGYHTAKAANVINQSKNCQIKRINTPYNSLSKRTVPERALTEACYYLLVKRPSLGCKMLRNVIKEFPKSDAAAEASGILNQSRIRTTQVRSTARSDEYENTLPDAEKTWQDIKQLAEGGRYQNAIDKAEIFIKAYPDNIYAGEIREQLLSWKRIVIKPKIEELLTRANNSKSEGDLDKASGYVLTVLSLDPNYSEAKTLHAQLESLKESRRIEAEKEKQFNELKGKAITYEAENNWENAIKTYQEALLVKGGNQEAKERLSICLYNYYIAQAKKEEAEGDLNSAIDLYTQALAQKQSDTIENRLESVKRKLQAETEKKRGKEEASKWLSKAQNAEKDDNFSDAISFYEKAQEYSEVSFTEKINSLKDKIAEKNKITEFGEQLKEARAASNQNPEQALKILERALELYPNNVEALDLKKQITEKNKQDEFSKQTSNIQTTERIPDKAVFPTYDLYQIQTLSGHNGWVTSAAFSPNGDRIVSGSFDLTARIWDAKSGNCLKSLEGHGQLVWAVDFSPDGRRVASGDGWNHTLKIWDAYTGTCIHTIKAHSGDIHGLSFSADGKYVASAGDDSLVKIWDVSTGTCVRTLKGHSNGVFCVAFSPDGKHIASGSWDKKVKIWDSDSGECIRTLTGHESTVERLSYSPDGAKIVSCSMWDNRMIIWDALKGEQLRNIKMYTTGQFYSVAFSPDGCYIVSGNNDGQIQLWDASTGACLRTIKAHKAFPNVIYSVKFSPDGKSILSAGCDKLIKVWALH